MPARQTCWRFRKELAGVLASVDARGVFVFAFFALVGCLTGVRLLLSVRTSDIGLHVGRD